MSEAIVDWISLERNFDKDPESITLVVEVFLRTIDGMLSKVRTAIDLKDPKAIAIGAHSLKGALANFGAKDAVALARLLEVQGFEGLQGDEEQIFMTLQSSVKEVVDELRSKVFRYVKGSDIE